MSLFNFIKLWKKFFDEGRYDNALEIFLKIFEKGIVQKDLFYFIIFSYFQKGDYYNAAVFIRKSEKYFWFQRDVFLIKNLMLWDFGKYEIILNAYEKIGELEHEFEFILISNVHRNIWNYKTALRVLFEGIRKFPNNSKLLYHMAIVFNFLWQKNKALFLAHKSFGADGYIYSLDLFLRILKSLGYMNNKISKLLSELNLNTWEYENDLTSLWNIFYTCGYNKKSEEFYKKSIRKMKFDFYAYNGISKLYYEQWLYLKAKSFCKMSIIINKRNIYSYNLMWKIFYKNGELEKAEKFLLKSLSFYFNFEALKILWLLYFKQWKIQKSKKFLLKAHSINGTDFMIKRYLGKIC